MKRPLPLLLGWLILPGCGSDETAVTVTPIDWDAKYRAANSIRQIEGQDEAMAKLATQAAEAGEWSMSRRALSGIRNARTHDEAARTCAVSFASLRRHSEARQIADKIYDTAIRDDALKQVAQTK